MLDSPALGVSPGAAHSSITIGTRPVPAVRMLRIAMIIAVLSFFFAGVPALNAAGVVPDYKVQQLGRYLCFALVAIGADLIWGYTGLLSLGQALFFCVGGYAVAMHLSLPEGGGIYDVPQFLTYVYYGHADPIPAFWKPFASPAFAVAAGILLSGILAALFGFFIFRSRVRGVYFSIITQAVAWGAWLLISQHEMLLGGTNGLTNFSKSFSEDRGWVIRLYLVTAACVTGGYLLCRALTRSRAGRVMVAIRDREMRLFFAGYKPYAFKVFAFSVAAMVGAVGGMLYPAQMGIITPQNMNVFASIEVVILVAVGGRGRLWGAVFGAVLVKTLQSTLSSDLPGVWPFLYGGMFVAVVLFFPAGFVGLWDQVEQSVAAGGKAGEASAAALAIAAVALFALAEVLGVMPAVLQAELSFSIGFWGKMCLFAGLLVALYLWLWRSSLRSDLPHATLLALGGSAAGLIVFVLMLLLWRDPVAFELRSKYVVMLLVLCVAGLIRKLSRRGERRSPAATAFEGVPAEAA